MTRDRARLFDRFDRDPTRPAPPPGRARSRRRRRRRAPPRRAAARGVPMPNPIATGRPRACRSRAPHRGRKIARERFARPGRPGARNDVEKPAREARGRCHARGGRGRRDEEDRVEPRRAQDGLAAAASSGGRSVTQRAVEPGRPRLSRRPREAAAQQRIQVREEDERERRLRADPAGDLEDRRQGRPRLEGPRGGALQDGTVGDRVRERNPELQEVRAGAVERPGQRDGVWPATGLRPSGTPTNAARPSPRARAKASAIRDTPGVSSPRAFSLRSRALIRIRPRLRRGVPSPRSRTRRNSSRSLSPRPERLMRIHADRGAARASLARICDRVRRSRARARCPRSRERSAKASSASRIGDLAIAHAPPVVERRVLGPDGRVVEPGRDRVRREDLAVAVLEEHRARSVKNAGGAAGEPGRVLAGTGAAPAGLDAVQRHARGEEGGEEPDRVGAAAHACDRGAAGRLPASLRNWRARLPSDDRLELAHDRRVRDAVRAPSRARSASSRRSRSSRASLR